MVYKVALGTLHSNIEWCNSLRFTLQMFSSFNLLDIVLTYNQIKIPRLQRESFVGDL